MNMIIIAVCSILAVIQQRQDSQTSVAAQDTENVTTDVTPEFKERGGNVKDHVLGEATRFSAVIKTTKKFKRTTPRRVSFAEDCDYLAHYCLKAYDTGVLCGRTLYYKYYTFKNYCLLDYVNCMERYEVWQLVHMGECFKVKELTEYLMYPYDDDYFLDQYYIVEDN